MSKSIHVTLKNLRGLSRSEINEQVIDSNSDLAQLRKKAAIKKVVISERKIKNQHD